MSDVETGQLVTGVIGALIGALIALVGNEVRLRRQREARRRTFYAAVTAEAMQIGTGLWRLLQPRSRRTSNASVTDQFLTATADFKTAGDVFFSQLSDSHVIGDKLVRLFTAAYVTIRAQASAGARLSSTSSASYPRGLHWEVEDGLTEGLQKLSQAMLEIPPSSR